MIALDTNVLVRFLVEDDARQSVAAASLVNQVAAEDDRLFVSDVVLCETVWVLAGSYGISKAAIIDTMRGLIRARHLAFDAPDRLVRALDAFERGKGDFADYVIREHARAAGCTAVATFDRSLLRDAGFVSPAVRGEGEKGRG